MASKEMTPVIHDAVKQSTPEWLALRVGKVTASELGNLLTPEFKRRTGDMWTSYLYTKTAEAFLGTIEQAWSSKVTDNGTMRETEARPWYELFTGDEVRQVGFVETEDGRFGCSPDGLIGDGSGLEIKCPERKAHLRYLCEGILPKDYAAQVHGSMYASGRLSWVFMSYHPKLPKFILTIQRDEAIQEKIASALECFYAEFDETMARLKELSEAQYK